MNNLNEFVEKLSEKHEIAEEVIENKYEEIKNGIKEEKPELSDEEVEKVALNRLDGRLSRMGSYDSVEMIVIGKTDKRDRYARVKREAKEEYEDNRDLAVASGIVDEDGTPLVTGEMEIQNKDIGDEIPTQYIQSIHGVDNEGKLVDVTLWGSESIKHWEDVEVGSKVTAQLLGNNGEESKVLRYRWGNGSYLEVEEEDNDLWEVIEELDDDYKHEIADVRRYVRDTSNLRDYDRLGIVQGYVRGRFLNPENPENSRRLTINDVNATNEEYGATVWLADNIEGVEDYGQDTWVAVVGTISLGQPYGDSDKRPIQVNASSVIAHPRLRFEPEGF